MTAKQATTTAIAAAPILTIAFGAATGNLPLILFGFAAFSATAYVVSIL